MTRIIFFDIDGTLVSFKTHRVPSSAIDAIRRVREQGVKVWIATGRPMPFINNLEGVDYDGIIAVNGAHCETREGKVIHNTPIDRSDVERMVAWQKESGMAVAYASNERAISVATQGVPGEVRAVYELLDIPQPGLFPPEEALQHEVMQIIAFYTAQQSPHIMGNILKGCSETRWHPHFADCVAMGTNKARGIDTVLKHYGFDISEAMAFGDGGNDTEMLRHVGIGVAMGNASDEVKASANHITSSVDEDGVAHALQKFFPIIR